MNNLSYVFKKRGANTPDETGLKTQFQKIYRGPTNPAGIHQYTLFETFWENLGLRGAVFDAKIPSDNEEQYKEKSKVSFINLVDDLNSPIYSFINVK